MWINTGAKRQISALIRGQQELICEPVVMFRSTFRVVVWAEEGKKWDKVAVYSKSGLRRTSRLSGGSGNRQAALFIVTAVQR